MNVERPRKPPLPLREKSPREARRVRAAAARLALVASAPMGPHLVGRFAADRPLPQGERG